ncbi:unnamed protein product [Schistosoma rodhaini]|uniref:Cadherin domain-containing protein n=1 Tax=Schistosoma rodhaini TaxID=6188 RepID=A0AA85FQV7_9TREM|nr:unnamed protein product [Schistosoma rodhaini]CAH8539366.1 unnamed protein product [Schistosoma rodhaini]
MNIGIPMAWNRVFVLAVLLCCVCLTVSSNGKVSVINLPHVSGEWYWKLRFFYPASKSMDGNVGELLNYTFIPKTTSSNVYTNETIKSDNQLISINLVMSTEGSKLKKCSLLLTVEQDEEYFAWTNMTLIYEFAEPLSTLSPSELPISEATISTSSDQKFLTRTDEVYICDTEIPIKFGQNIEILFSSMTFQAFKAEETIRPDRLQEVCPRDFKSNIPIAALTGVSLLVVVILIISIFGINAYLAHLKSTLQYQQELQNNQRNTIKDSNSLNSINVTECIELKDANSKFINQQNGIRNSSSRNSNLPPLNRITVISQDDFHQLCALLEFRGYFLITYTNNSSKETICYRIPIDLTEKYSTKENEISSILEKSYFFMNFNNNTHSNNLLDINKSKLSYIEPDNLIIITTNSSCCNNFLRCFTLPFNFSRNENSLIKNWIIDFYWNRTPEMYEFGEEGWSSVGSPVGALSGVYDLVDVKLKYHFDEKFGLDFLMNENGNKEFIVHSLAEKRLQARVGDYYECVSQTQFVFDTENNTIVNSNDNYIISNGDKWNIIMSLQSVRSQAFADVNVPEFTGATFCP